MSRVRTSLGVGTILVAGACTVMAAATTSGAAQPGAPAALMDQAQRASTTFSQLLQASGETVDAVAVGVGTFHFDAAAAGSPSVAAVDLAARDSPSAAAAPSGFTCTAGVTRRVSQRPVGPRTRHDVFYKGTTLCSNFPRLTPRAVPQTGRADLQVLPFTTTIDVGETYNRRTARAVSTGLYGTFANPRLRGHLNAYFGAPRGGLWDVGTNGCRPIFNNTVLHCIRSTAEFRPANA